MTNAILKVATWAIWAVLMVALWAGTYVGEVHPLISLSIAFAATVGAVRVS